MFLRAMTLADAADADGADIGVPVVTKVGADVLIEDFRSSVFCHKFCLKKTKARNTSMGNCPIYLSLQIVQLHPLIDGINCVHGGLKIQHV